MRKKLANLQRLILSDKNTRNLFFFLLLNLFFAFVELFYGLWTNSLGLLSDSFHMLFDCSALLLGLAASIIAKWRPNEKFTYGFGRAETLAGLANGLFLLFIAMFIMKEAIERTFEPPEVHHERLFVISVLGFLVNIIGIFVFQHGGQGHHHNHIFGGSCSSHSHSHDHSNGHHHNHNHHHHADEMHGLYSAPTISSKPSVASQSRGGGGGGGGLVALDMNGYTPGSHPVINPSSAMHADPHDHHKHHHNNNYDDSYHHVHNHHHSSPLDSAPLIHEDFSPSMPNTNRPARSKGRGQIMQSVFLHIVADTLGSVGVMISAILMNQFGWMIADPLCSLFIAILISISVYPLLRDAVYILMQRIPVELEDKLPDCMHRVRSLPGVQMVHDAHFWTLGSDTFIGSLKVDVAREADHVYIQVNTKGILSEIGVDRVNVEINIV